MEVQSVSYTKFGRRHFGSILRLFILFYSIYCQKYLNLKQSIVSYPINIEPKCSQSSFHLNKKLSY